MSKDNASPFIAGIGSSAGGIEALIELVSSLPAKLNASIVIAQHLSPSHKSQMTDILKRETHLIVNEITNGCLVENNTIYIGPAGSHIRYSNGQLFLDNEPGFITPKPSVNILLESLADELGDHAIGVVLSGTGSDGARGIKAVKSVGGFTIVQEPDSAKYDGMPLAAIEAVEVDKIALAEDIGQEIANFTNNVSHDYFPSSDEKRFEILETLFELVKQETRIDFTFYKRSTLLRRINRRIISSHAGNLEQYLTVLKKDKDEVRILSKELLISVTNFFRDKTAFTSLKYYISEIVRNKAEGEVIRIWVPGCATGEEAYSIAILFLDEVEKQGKRSQVRVFATDIDEEALQIARKGSYSAHSVNTVDIELLDKYFRFSNETYVPLKQLRESITFSRQDITRDPPFLHLDMITFRNVLIYFTNELQRRVLTILRYALNQNGILFLGKSESTGMKEEFFVAADRKSRIFKVSQGVNNLSIPKFIGASAKKLVSGHVPKDQNETALFDAALKFAGPCLLINNHFQILHTHGDIKPFIGFPDGAPELNLSRLICTELAAELVSGLAKAKRDESPVRTRSHKIHSVDGSLWYLDIQPVEKSDFERFFVRFSRDYGTQVIESVHDDYNKADIAELLATREQLQTLTEEMAASAEEMQALNEEVQAANEELQANNEELEATNEELQATNEELISVNEESIKKSADLSEINVELESMYNTIDFPVFVFDTSLRLKRSNDAANRKYHLNVGIYRKSISEMNLPDYFSEIERQMRQTISRGGKLNFLLQHSEYDTYNVFITPVISANNSISSVILVLINNSELVKAHNRVEKSQEQLLAIMNNSLSVVALKDTSGRYEFVNTRFEETFGLDSADLLGKTDKQLFDELAARQLRERDLETMRTLMPHQTLDEIFAEKGKIILESVRFPVFDSDGTVKSICTQANDVSNARHANEQLKLAGKLFDRTGEAILVTDNEGYIITTNQAFTDFSGYSVKELIGANPHILSSGRHSEGFYQNMYFTIEHQGYWQGEVINKSKNGEEITVWLTINAVKDADGGVVNYVASYSDINEIKNVQRKIEFLATHDELTRLPNRNLLMERLDIMLSNARRQETWCAVLFFDLDDFKNINDSLGHDIGDLLLKQVSKRLQKCVRDTDILARMGGDEFVAVVSAKDIKEIEDVADRIIKTVNAPFEIDEHALFVTASMGIAIYPADGETNFALLKNADTAMYRAKELGRNQYQYFTEQMRNDAEEKMEIERCIRGALNDNLFEIEYQPQIDVKTGKIVGAEALLRSNNGVLSSTNTGAFIEVAEKGRLIDEVGLHVLTKILSDVKQWRDEGLNVPKISVNVSAKQLKNNRFIQQAKMLLEDFDIDPSFFKIEVTETALMEKVDKSIDMLNQIKDLGISISVDDFGVGQSSLSYLRKLPIQELKIDQSFIKGLVDEPDDRAITNSIIRMGQALGLTVVAEGVECEAQLNALREERCEIVQGFHFYKPLKAEAFKELMQAED